MPEVKAKADSAAAAGNWNDAMLWANQWYQYQVKAADIGLRAKAQLDELGATPSK
jgi:nitrous-oxide reductase